MTKSNNDCWMCMSMDVKIMYNMYWLKYPRGKKHDSGLE